MMTFPPILTLFLVSAGLVSTPEHLPHHEKELTQYTRESWTTDDGLPQNSVNAITQTGNGYIWVATQEGLVMFDGVQFTTFDKQNTPEINNNYITSLLVDNNDRLWIATYGGGLLTYSQHHFESVQNRIPIVHSYARTIYQDAKHRMWFAIRGRGVARLDHAGSVTVFDTTNGLSNNEVWSLCEDALGRIWIGTENGISILDNSTFSYFTPAMGLPSKYVNALITDNDSSVWIGTNNGVINVRIQARDKKPIVTYSQRDGLPDRITYCLARDSKHSLWVGTRNGLALLSHGSISTLTEKENVGFTNVSTLFQDREHNMWVGRDGGGLEVFRDGLFTTYGMNEGLPSNVAWTIFEDTGRNLWIGTDGGLIMMSENSRKPVQRYSTQNGLYDNEVYSVGQDSSGAVWVGSTDGINVIKNGIVREVEPVAKTKNVVVSCILKDSHNRMWVATSGNGVYRFQGDRLSIFTTKEGLASNYDNSLYEGQDGSMYVGTDGEGISIITDTNIRTISMTDGLSSNFIHSIFGDEHGTIWIGTFGAGVNRIKHGKISAITTRQGLFDDVIFNIIEDDFGRMWFTSNKGIFNVNKEELEQCADGKIPSITCMAFGKESGLRSNECNGGVQPAGWKSANGRLWFPTSGGVSTLDPSAIVVNTTPPLVDIQEVLGDNKAEPLDSDIVLPPGNERLEIHYTGLSFLNPKQITFKVKLDGYDKGWENVGTRRAAYYTHLPAGTYVFHVIAGNSDGAWSKQGAAITIIRSASFYETWIFFAGVLVVIIVGIYGAYRTKIRMVRQREFELQHLVDERTADLRRDQAKIEELLRETERQRESAVSANTLKSQLIDMVAHHLKSPLVSIKGLTNELEQSTTLNGLGLKYLKMIRFGTERMITLISNLLNLSIIESGQISFSMERHNLAELAGVMIDSYKFQAAKKEQVLTFVADDDDDLTVNADSTRLQEAIENLVSNAIKYSPIGSTIRAGVYRFNSVVRFWVTDSGPGIPAEDRQRLFQRFQVLKSKPTGGEVATGLGLAIVKEIVERHNGKVDIKSEMGSGSTFIIELPAA